MKRPSQFQIKNLYRKRPYVVQEMNALLEQYASSNAKPWKGMSKKRQAGATEQ